MRKIIYVLLILPFAFSFSVEGILSSALDFVPGIGNAKSFGEGLVGKDLVTGEELSKTERMLSLLGSIPGINFLKNGKHLKNGQKFLKAAQRAKNAGKIKNAVNFFKAGTRAMNKAEKVQKTAKNIFKAAKAFFKGKDE